MKMTMKFVVVVTVFSLIQANAVMAETQLKGGFKASNVIGKGVKNPTGKELGQIEEIVLTQDGTVGYAVLSFGGFLGLGDKYFAVPWKALRLNETQDRLVLAVGEEKLQNAPGFDKTDWPDVSDPEWILAVHEFYGVPQKGQGTQTKMDLEQHAHFSANKGYLVGGEGKTGNSVRYDGSKIWEGPSYAVVDVDPKDNTGVLLGIVRTQDHTYTILMTKFQGKSEFMDGGIVTDLELHGTTGQGAPLFPKVKTYVAGWGKATVFKDDDVLYKQYPAHFMLTEGVRDESTHQVHYVEPEKLKILMASRKKGSEEGNASREAMQSIKQEVKQAHEYVNPNTMQLHLVAHSPEKDAGNLPPYKEFIHFMFDQVSLEDTGKEQHQFSQKNQSKIENRD